MQLIRGQIITWWALDELSANSSAAAKKMDGVVSLLAEIGQLEGLESVLEIAPDNSAAGGWFAPAWEAMRTIDWYNNFDTKAANIFLSRFTFNYH